MKFFQIILRSINNINKRNAEACDCFIVKKLRLDEIIRLNNELIKKIGYFQIKQQERDREQNSSNLNLPLIHGKEKQNILNSKNIGNI